MTHSDAVVLRHCAVYCAGVGVPQPHRPYAHRQQVPHGLPCRPAAIPVAAVDVLHGLPGPQHRRQSGPAQVSSCSEGAAALSDFRTCHGGPGAAPIAVTCQTVVSS